MRVKTFLPLAVLFAVALAAPAFAAEPAPASSAAAQADGPIITGNAQAVPPRPAPGQPPAVLAAPPPSDADMLLPNDPRAKPGIHGQVGSMFDSRGGHSVWGSAEGPIGDTAWLGISVAESKFRW
jgi:hypothetical protein